MSAPLSDPIIFCVARLVDDAQATTREPSHSKLDSFIGRAGIGVGDPKTHGQSVGKAKRVTAALNWALANNVEGGQRFVEMLIDFLRSSGGFRPTAPNFVGEHPIKDAIAAFDIEGFTLTEQGVLHAKVLDNLSGAALTAALSQYVERAKRGSEDAALMVGTAKDLLEAVAGHILVQRSGNYPAGAHFEPLLGMAFGALGLATPAHAVQAGEPWHVKIERSTFTLALGINGMRNKQGTGHGRPWLPTVSAAEAKIAVQHMGNIAEWLLHKHKTVP